VQEQPTLPVVSSAKSVGDKQHAALGGSPHWMIKHSGSMMCLAALPTNQQLKGVCQTQPEHMLPADVQASTLITAVSLLLF
jgi:hypothetical protein